MTSKFVHGGKDRLLECNLKCVQFATTRNELIEIYKAAKKVFGNSPELSEIISACQAKQNRLNNAKL